MKLVIAIIKPFKLEEVRDALVAVGVHGMTVTEVKGYGRQKGHTEIYRGAEYAVNFLPEDPDRGGGRRPTASPRWSTPSSVSAKTGQIGDGKIFVTAIDQAVRIRTGETDTDALCTSGRSTAANCHRRGVDMACSTVCRDVHAACSARSMAHEITCTRRRAARH